MEIHVNGKAGHESHDSCVEETEEDCGSEEGNDSNNDHWAKKTADFFSIFGDEFHDSVKTEEISNNNSNFTEKGEDLGNEVGKTELKHVLNVQEETVPGRTTEAVTRDGHVGKGSGVQVIANLFDASQNAVTTGNQAFDHCVFTTGLSCLLGNVKEDESNKLDYCNNE